MGSWLAGKRTSDHISFLQDVAPRDPALKDGSPVNQAAGKHGEWGTGREGRNRQEARSAQQGSQDRAIMIINNILLTAI